MNGKGIIRSRIGDRRMGFSLLLTLVILVLTGILVVFSASSYMASIKLDAPFYYFKKQIEGAVLGFIVILILANFNYQHYRKLKWLILGAPTLLLLAVFIPGIGVSVNGSARWLDLGFITIQPSEIVKFALVMFIAIALSDQAKDIRNLKKGFLPLIGIVGVLCGIILKQPNFSMVVCIAIITFIMFYVGGANLWHLAGLCALGVIGAVILIIFEPYRMERITAFLDPWADPSDGGYQLIQSFYALAGGGIFGRGLGMSQQKLLFLPYGESDFVFPIFAEEFGIFGVLALLALYLFLVDRGIRIAVRCKDRLGSMLASGVTALIGVQVAIHVAVVTGSIPPTGQTLPFISAGSSSLIMFMAAIGVLINVSRNCAEKQSLPEQIRKD